MKKSALIKKLSSKLKLSEEKAQGALQIILQSGIITHQKKDKVVKIKTQKPITKTKEVIKEVVKEVPVIQRVEVIREVEIVREVPVIQKVEIIKEVIKEVPVVKTIEVIREVEVVKEVPVYTTKESQRVTEITNEIVKEVIKEVAVTTFNTKAKTETGSSKRVTAAVRSSRIVAENTSKPKGKRGRPAKKTKATVVKPKGKRGRPRKAVDPNAVVKPKGKRGRPKKVVDPNAVVKPKGKRGRPKKVVDPNAVVKPKGKRGRPKKAVDPNAVVKPKGKRGRPKKAVAAKATAKVKAKVKKTKPAKVKAKKKVTKTKAVKGKRKVTKKAPVASSKYSGIKKNDLKVVEGVGPALERLLNDGGIKTWGKLASTSKEDVSKILMKAGSKYKMHDPKTWSDQAKMADAGMWDELVSFQKGLDGGKTNKSNKATPSKVEKLAGIK